MAKPRNRHSSNAATILYTVAHKIARRRVEADGRVSPLACRSGSAPRIRPKKSVRPAYGDAASFFVPQPHQAHYFRLGSSLYAIHPAFGGDRQLVSAANLHIGGSAGGRDPT